MQQYNIVIIGGGPAGLAAAIAAYDAGERSILVLERDNCLGGILNQCIHNGFGLHTFKEELTGPEYAARYIAQLEERGIAYKLSTMVLDISAEKVVTAMNSTDGLFEIHASAVVLAMGCRERSRGALNIPGYRPAGVYAAGTAQRLVNMEGYLPGRRVVILGSGDIGLIMARRMTLEGAQVLCVAELMPYSGGLKRNIVQCLNDFDIPLKLSHTVVDIEGKERVTGITLARVDERLTPIPGTEEHFDCDTLLLSCGLIPENELSRGIGIAMSPITSGPLVNESLETSCAGVFAAGNVLHVHDLVDFVSEEAAAAGRAAAAYVNKRGACHASLAHDTGDMSDADHSHGADSTHDIDHACDAGHTHDAEQSDTPHKEIGFICEGGPRYTVPATIRPDQMPERVTVRFRVGSVLQNKFINVYFGEQRVLHRKRPIMAPGEMEEVVLQRKFFDAHPDLTAIRICVEEA